MKKNRRLMLIFLLMILSVSLMTVVVVFANSQHPTGDPSGANTGSIYDITAKKPGAPTLDEIALQVGKVKIGLNFVWVLLTGMLIFYFQAGFALVETGFTRAKNAMHTMAMNLMVF